MGLPSLDRYEMALKPVRRALHRVRGGTRTRCRVRPNVSRKGVTAVFVDGARAKISENKWCTVVRWHESSITRRRRVGKSRKFGSKFGATGEPELASDVGIGMRLLSFNGRHGGPGGGV